MPKCDSQKPTQVIPHVIQNGLQHLHNTVYHNLQHGLPAPDNAQTNASTATQHSTGTTTSSTASLHTTSLRLEAIRPDQRQSTPGTANNDVHTTSSTCRYTSRTAPEYDDAQTNYSTDNYTQHIYTAHDSTLTSIQTPRPTSKAQHRLCPDLQHNTHKLESQHYRSHDYAQSYYTTILST